MIEDLQKLAEDVSAARAAVADLRGIGESPDGVVRVTVDGDGQLVDLELDPRIYRVTDSAALAEVIKAAFGSALEDATRQAFDIMRGTILPAGEEAVDLVVDPLLEQIRRRTERGSSWPR
jgi:DNA-binding protein YbaB